jgi:hypothetical protein
MHQCDFNTHKIDFHTYSVILTRIRMNMSLTSVITTRSSVIYTHRVRFHSQRFLHAERKFYRQCDFATQGWTGIKRPLRHPYKKKSKRPLKFLQKAPFRHFVWEIVKIHCQYGQSAPVDTHGCDYDTHDCDFNMYKSDFYTQNCDLNTHELNFNTMREFNTNHIKLM